MKSKLISLQHLCTHYQIEMNFINNLGEMGLIEIKTIEQSLYIHSDKLNDFEKILRLRDELDVNVEGIDIIFHLLQKLEAKDKEINTIKNKLKIYEH